MTNLTNKMLGVVAGLIVVMIWSGWIVISKHGLDGRLTPWDITEIRFITSTIIVMPLLLFNKSVTRTLFSFKVMTCSLCCGSLYLITSLIGLETSAASNTGIIVNGSLPIISAILIYLLTRKKITKNQFISIFIIFFANYILIYNDNITLSSFIFFVISAAFLSFYAVSMQLWNISIKTIMFAVPIVNCVFFTPIWFFLPSQLNIASANEILVQALYQGIVVGLIALFFMSYSINVLGSVSASTIMALVPIVALIFSSLFLHEQIAITVVVSAVLSTIGIFLYNFFSIKKYLG